jgi:hypothetical protein
MKEAIENKSPKISSLLLMLATTSTWRGCTRKRRDAIRAKIK